MVLTLSYFNIIGICLLSIGFCLFFISPIIESEKKVPIGIISLILGALAILFL